MSIAEIYIVEESNKGQFEVEVNRLLKEGWVLQGGVHFDLRTHNYMIAMVFPKKSKINVDVIYGTLNLPCNHTWATADDWYTYLCGACGETYDKQIKLLELTKRTTDALLAENIETIKDLCECTIDRLKKTPNIGRKHIREIMDVLETKGLKLKDA